MEKPRRHNCPHQAAEVLRAAVVYAPGLIARVAVRVDNLLDYWSGGEVQDLLGDAPEVLDWAFCRAVRGCLH